MELYKKPKPPTMPNIKPPGPGGTPTNYYGSSVDGFKNQVAAGKDPGWQGLVGAMPGYSGIIGNDGKMGSLYDYNPSDSKTFNKMSKMANQEGPTDIYNQQNKLISMNLNNDLDLNAIQSNNAYGEGISGMAQSGGVDAGSRERLAQGSAASRMRGVQGASNAASIQRGQAGAADAALKVNLMGNVADAENKAGMWNAGNAIDDRQNFNQFNQDLYKNTGAIYGNAMIADRMGGGDGGGKKPANPYNLPDNPATGAPMYQTGDAGTSDKDLPWYHPANLTMSSGGDKKKKKFNPLDPSTY